MLAPLPGFAALLLEEAASPLAELEQVRALAREAAREMDDPERMTFAHAFCERAMIRYWAVSVDGGDELGGMVPCPVTGALLNRHAAALAERAGEAAARLPAPFASYALTTLYASLLPDRRRSEDGVFYTPPALVQELLGLLDRSGVRWDSTRVVDPAAGGGAFVVAAAARIRSALMAKGASAGEVIAHLEDNLCGVELDPFSAWMCRVLLDSSLWADYRAAGVRLRDGIQVRNAMELPDRWRGGFDVVLGNPPYGRVTLDAATRSRFARSLFGHANLYGIFLDLAVRLCRPAGVVGFVTPASFLGGEYFKRLRATLMSEAPPVAVDFVTDRGGVFDEVLQETVLAVLRRGAKPRPIAVRSVQPVSLEAPCRVVTITSVSLAGSDPGSPWTLPRSHAAAELLRRAVMLPYRLTDYGLGVSTGPLVWNRHKGQLVAKRTRGCYPLIWAESVLPGGEFSFRAERRNHQPYFRVLPGQNHLLLNESVVLVQRTTAKEQQRRLVAALLPATFVTENGGVVVENHVNMVRQLRARGRVPLEAVAALLNSDVVDSVFRCTSGSVAVSAYELESLPVPSPDVMHQLHSLLKSGAGPAAAEAFLRRAYGGPAEAAA